MGNLVDLPRLMLSMKNKKILKKSLMVDSLLKIITARESQKFRKPMELYRRD